MKKLLTNIGMYILMGMMLYGFFGFYGVYKLTMECIYTIEQGHGSYISPWVYGIIISYVVSVVVVISWFALLIFLVKKGATRQKGRQELYGEKLKDMRHEVDLTGFMRSDVGFSKDKFMIRAKKMLMESYNARDNGDTSRLRLVLGDTLFATWIQQLEANKRQGLAACFERFFISKAKLIGYWVSDGYDHLQLACVVNYKTCVKNQSTGEVVEGDLNSKIVKKMKVLFKRKQGIKTNADSDVFDIEHCPNCGASLAISVKGVCDYCGREVSSGKFQWVLEAIEEEFIEEMTYDMRGLKK